MDKRYFDDARTLSRAETVVRDGHVVMTVASMYAPWERVRGGRPIYADASAHRLLSDLSGLIGSRTSHRIVAAGDLNILRGYGDHGDPYWQGRYSSVFERAEALGLRYVGPRAPNGRQAQPWPDELPRDSDNVPTLPLRKVGSHRNSAARLCVRFGVHRRSRRATRSQRD